MTPEELELKKYQARMSLWRTGIIGGTVAILTAIISGIVSLVISYQENNAKIELERENTQREMRLKWAQSDDAIMAKFIEFAIKDDIDARIRFAQYLSIVNSNPESRKRWEKYYNSLLEKRDHENKH